MLNLIRGTIIHSTENTITVDVSGIGFELHVAHPDIHPRTTATTWHVYFHWNQENGPTLFGFALPLERSLFMAIISCSGIGPKIGLTMLRESNPADIIRMIQSADITGLSSVPGIGAKKAEQLIVALKHKVNKLIDSGVISSAAPDIAMFKDVSEALYSLNYSKPEVSRALQQVREQFTQPPFVFDQLLRSALSFLSKRS